MMADDDSADALNSHGREGSTTACQILLLLHQHAELGLPASALQVFLGLSRADLTQALQGLKQRHRVVPIGRGTESRWLLTQNAPRPADAQPATPQGQTT